VGESRKKSKTPKTTAPSEPSAADLARSMPVKPVRRAAVAGGPGRWAVALFAVVAFTGVMMWWRESASQQHTRTARAEALRVNVLAEHPHDPEAFTQGLQWIDGNLFEGTGLHGRSSLRRIDLSDWSVEQHVDLPAEVFGEGIAVVGDRIFEITWQDGLAYVWNRATFERVAEHHYEGEGWGICWDGTHLVMSDGSDRLTFRDPETFAEVRHVRVRRGRMEIDQLNELECVDGLVYANIWQTDDIARIDPSNGRVTGWIDASNLLTDEEARDADVLNGITYLPDSHRFLLTGKLWPRSFEVEFVPDED
jgi:glutamine cyclotransferase